jgi:5-methylthioadenosine/S-adenosylhomocysteine deaminase
MLQNRGKVLIRNARLLDIEEATNEAMRQADVLITDGTIATIGTVDPEVDTTCDRVIDARDRLVAPGLVNAHTHSPSSVMAGIGDDLSHPVFMWLTQAYTSNRTPEEIYLSAMLNCIQMLRSGTTAAIDHFPGQRFGPPDMDAVLRASHDSGMRIALGMRFFDSEFSDIFPRGRPIPEDLEAVGVLKPQPLSGLRELMEDTIKRWHGTDDRISVFAAPSNPERCSDDALVVCGELAEKYDVGIHTHLLESRIQAELAQEKYGCTMVEHLHRLGILSHRWSCAHSIWVTDEDIDRLAEAGAVVVHNPESNLKLGTGIAPIPKMLERGVSVALGTDGSSANDNLLMHEAMRLAAIIHRPSQARRSDWISSRDVWRMATQGGAKALLQGARIGDIRVGRRADIVLYRLDEPWWKPVNDPVSQMVFAETGGSVDTVIVDGRIVVENGRITAFDADALLAEIDAMMARIRKRNQDIFRVARRMGDLFS